MIDYFLEKVLSEDEKPIIFMDVACAFIIREDENGNKLLLVLKRAADDHWPLHYDLPRGKCDKPMGEEIMHCLKRETKEETGLDIFPLKFLGKFKYIADGGKRESTQYNYLCMMMDPDQKIKISKEHDEARWIMSGGEAEMLLTPEMKKIALRLLDQKETIVGEPSTALSTDIEEFLFRNSVPKKF